MRACTLVHIQMIIEAENWVLNIIRNIYIYKCEKKNEKKANLWYEEGGEDWNPYRQLLSPALTGIPVD